MTDKGVEKLLDIMNERRVNYCHTVTDQKEPSTVTTTATTGNYQYIGHDPYIKEFNFDEVVDARLKKIRSTLSIKAKEYIREDNPFHNMDCAANDLNKEPEDALIGMAIKHWISIKDMVNDLYEDKLPTEAMIDEKLGDWINWMILLEGLFKRRLNS